MDEGGTPAVELAPAFADADDDDADDAAGDGAVDMLAGVLLV